MLPTTKFSIVRHIPPAHLRQDRSNKNGNDDDKAIDCPASNDVLFQHGTSHYSHPGNVRYRRLMEQCSDEGSWSEVAVANFITNEVHRRGGRFLERDAKHAYWLVLLDYKQIGRRIYHSFYNFQKSHEAKKRNQIVISSASVFECTKRQKLGCCNIE